MACSLYPSPSLAKKARRTWRSPSCSSSLLFCTRLSLAPLFVSLYRACTREDERLFGQANISTPRSVSPQKKFAVGNAAHAAAAGVRRGQTGGRDVEDMRCLCSSLCCDREHLLVSGNRLPNGTPRGSGYGAKNSALPSRSNVPPIQAWRSIILSEAGAIASERSGTPRPLPHTKPMLVSGQLLCASSLSRSCSPSRA